MRIDWTTLALETFNVLILVWLLGRFLFRPVMDIVKRRQAEQAKMFAEADVQKHEMLRAQEDMTRTRVGLEMEREKILAEARDAALAERAKMLEQVRTDMLALKTATEADIARMRAGLERALEDKAMHLAMDIAQRLLMRVAPKETANGFLEGIAAKIKELPAATRSTVVAAAQNGLAVEVRSAVPLDAEAETHVTRVIRESFGADLPLKFAADPDLVAGLELHGPNVTICNSLRADLQHLRAELTGDGTHV